MEYFAVRGGVPLRGSVRVHGAKNSALPILAATLLARGESVIHNCPDLTDVSAALDILKNLGCRVRRERDTVLVDTTGLQSHSIPNSLMGRMRASVLFLGALLARSGQATACWPGGCALGPRPIDLHLRAFSLLGAQVEDREDRIRCRAEKLVGARIVLPFPSVGATENAMLCACGAEGVTEIVNAAREPEIEDLQGFLRCLGARVRGAGSSRIVIEGGRPLHPGEFTVMSDRIVAATYLCAIAAAGGEGEVLGGSAGHIRPVLRVLSRAGCRLACREDRIWLKRTEPLQGVGQLITSPYPGLATDVQPLLAAALATGRGETKITETVFEHRFRYTAGLGAMGASVSVEGDTASITGATLHGASVTADDLRGGAALTVAALAAQGKSEIYGLAYIDRGYARLEKDLSRLGGRIRREAR